MLVRCAGRRQHHRHTSSTILAASFAQLNLPWLAPAQLRWTASQAARSRMPSSRDARRFESSRVTNSRTQLRRLATATDQYTPRSSSQAPPVGLGSGFRNVADEHVPFDFSTFTDGNQTQFTGLEDRTRPTMLDNLARPYQHQGVILTEQGLTGSVRDLLGHLHTTLGVGRRDRAEAIIQRLADHIDAQSPELAYAHSVYLQNLLQSVMLEGRDSPQSQALLKDMQRWFEVEIRNKGVTPEPSLLIPVMRAAIRALDGPRRERTIRRYAEMAKELGDEVMDDVLLSEEYDDNEFAILGRATSQYYEDVDTSDALAATEPAVEAAESQPEVSVRGDLVDLGTIPDVRATEQKGVGLDNIKRAMDIFKEMPDASPDASPEARQELAHARQRRLEDTSVEIAVDRWKKADEDLRKIGIHTSMQSRPMAALMWQWYQKLLPALELELQEAKKTMSEMRKTDDRTVYGPYLEMLPMKKVAANTILYIMTRMANGKDRTTGTYISEAKLNSLTVMLSRSIEAECLASVARQKASAPQNRKANTTSQIRRQAVSALKKGIDKANASPKTKAKKASQAMLAEVEWPLVVHAKLGAMLVSKLLECAHLPVTKQHPRTKEMITQMQPAFLHRLKYEKGKKTGVISPNPALLDKLQSEPVGSLIAKRMPMVVEPKPWTGWSDGGYLHYSNPVLRLQQGDKSSKEYFMAADQNNDLDTLYKGLTALGKVPWKVHQGVFKVQLEAWNSGEAIANFAPLNPEMNMPPEPDSSADPLERRKWLAEIKELGNRKGGYHSKRCFQNFQLEIARTLLNETLYFPHNMDFRGRAYPIPPYLNHMGADNVRGLLVFADGKELGENGLRWLKIHMATVAGHDKASLEERVEFTMEHLDDIYDSVRDPLGGRRWWLQAEDAWQTLAACFELTAALDSPDPTKFVSHLPIQQDGTCNGLQHYAALGGDKAGAAQVNLEPSDRPADVYTAVAEAVKAEVEKDAKDGNPIAQKLHGRITRKCVKQPVMTNVYGVTFFGARAQVRKQLEVLFPEVKQYDTVNLGNMSHYIALKIFKSLGEMFAGAQAIQNWLGQCADRISTCLTAEQVEELKGQTKKVARAKKAKTEKKAGKKGAKNLEQAEESEEGVVLADTVKTPKIASSKQKKSERGKDEHALSKPLFRSTVVWTTPLRLPVVQPYRSAKSKVVVTSMQSIALQDPQVWDPVSRRKQLQAFPPNFIHSLDATHMLLSALACDQESMTFASIHDSFWTHACDVNRLSEVLRDAFIAMHGEDIIGRLREEFETRYKGCMYMASVLADSPVGQRITARRLELKSEAKERNDETMPSELGLEAERMRLLNSEDPAENAKGEAMITPGSIVLAESDTTAFAAATELAGQKLGEMPVNPLEVEASAEMDAAVLDDAADQDLDAAAAVSGENDEESDTSAKTTSDTNKAKTPKKVPRKLYVWLPLTMPEVPAKGDFDVTRLRESRYFFH
ncbi:DNA-directed RNA polymerase, mitochondrial [Pseudocercospora fuligena]|uniref:DNA-directed RNA polymerase n=1 Tax=Pseudocercospora fuligena TaxID=685502 RepID=A0A8H6VNC4_9PEZI|nr:DNA-directed RNA polymerase, mitochondrial [Pseudocercospora fuligena]